MNRRSFLSAISAALVFDPERALWRPGEKLISIPKPRDPRIIRSGDRLFVTLSGPTYPIYNGHGVTVLLEDPIDGSRMAVASIGPLDGEPFYIAPKNMRVIGYNAFYHNPPMAAKVTGLGITEDGVIGRPFPHGPQPLLDLSRRLRRVGRA